MTYASTRIAVRFSRLLQQLEPLAPEVTRAKLRVAMIGRRLATSFKVYRTQLVGSHIKGTAIRRISDVDVFVVFRREQLRWGSSYVRSGTLLTWVRRDLEQRFTATVVEREGVAVNVAFGAGQTGVDVVPAMYYGPHSDGSPLFLIPDGTDDWLPTSPAAQLKYFRQYDARSVGKLRRVIQLMKHWRHMRSPSVPLGSFHTELVLASSRITEGPISYSAALAKAFVLLDQRGGAALRDPLGISGLVHAVHTDPKREILAAALSYASRNAVLALEAESRGDVAEAVYRWRLVFNGGFPN